MTHRFDGRVVAVTGAGSGLGEAYAELLARLGAQLVLNDIDPRVETVAHAIHVADGSALCVIGDIADPQTASMVVREALRHYGRLDAVINNAGIGLRKPFGDTALHEFRRVMDVHYFGTVHLIQAVWPHMQAQRYGRIVNTISSTLYGYAGYSAYGAAKGAIFGLSRSLALEGAPLGIHVNLLAPGAATPMVFANSVDPATMQRMRETMRAALVAPTAAYLAHECCITSGLSYFSAGGLIAQMQFGRTEGRVIAKPDIDSVATAFVDPTLQTGFIAMASVEDDLARRPLPRG